TARDRPAGARHRADRGGAALRPGRGDGRRGTEGAVSLFGLIASRRDGRSLRRQRRSPRPCPFRHLYGPDREGHSGLQLRPLGQEAERPPLRPDRDLSAGRRGRWIGVGPRRKARGRAPPLAEGYAMKSICPLLTMVSSERPVTPLRTAIGW